MRNSKIKVVKSGEKKKPKADAVNHFSRSIPFPQMTVGRVEGRRDIVEGGC